MKRKWEDSRGDNFNSPTDIELHLETPLPLEWQRCLDIQSGQIHFYNTKTHKRTSIDPRRKIEHDNSPSGEFLSLDLELNLNGRSMIRNNSSGQLSKKKTINGDYHHHHQCGLAERALKHGVPNSWLRLEREETTAEMVARVCMHCHLLVMLLKSSPTCPNCKFIQPLYLQTSPTTTTLCIASNPTNKNNQSQSFKSFPNPIQNNV